MGLLQDLVRLSNRIGADPELVQPGGGNTSVKLFEPDFFGRTTRALVIKGSGTDLRTITEAGFTHLDLERCSRLQAIRGTDEEMMAMMRASMLFPHRDPLPSVETPLHSLLPFTFVVHTHDVASLSLTDTTRPEELLRECYGDQIVWLEYVRPGYPLAMRMLEKFGGQVPRARGLALIKHGLVTWGRTAEECWDNLMWLVRRANRFVKRPKVVAPKPSAARALAAAEVLPKIRGAVGHVICHYDDTVIDFPKNASPATPEHILRAGLKPVFFQDLMREARKPHPIPDWLKAVLVPGVGLVTFFVDKASAETAAACVKAALKVIAGAERVDRFRFLTPKQAREIEVWPLERRKIEQALRNLRPLQGRIALVLGGASGIGRATVEKLRSLGTAVVSADLPEVDVRDIGSLREAVRNTVLEYGGLDILFYTAGVQPELMGVQDMDPDEVERQLQVHYKGAVLATREAAKVMIAQGLGGRIIYNVSKAAFAPGRLLAAYGAAKAALAHYARNAAAELGRYKITVNYVNADAIDTPMFRTLVKQRAKEQGITEKEMLRRYAERAVLGQAAIPPQAVAEAVAWLASDAARYTTGCVITVGGGTEGFPR